MDISGSGLFSNWPSILCHCAFSLTCLSIACLEILDLIRSRFWNIFMFSESIFFSCAWRWLFFRMLIWSVMFVWEEVFKSSVLFREPPGLWLCRYRWLAGEPGCLKETLPFELFRFRSPFDLCCSRRFCEGVTEMEVERPLLEVAPWFRPI